MRPLPPDICAFGDLTLIGLRTSRSTFESDLVLGAALEPSEITCRIVDYVVFAANLTTVRFFAPRQIRQ